ncbi:hypothetical protein [Ensifer soli]|uniref:hypothetical protein n=1 Tax=Ciceribacter sp. sgz301302 TaxID=3342379 RepID=UPI0035B75532
MPISEAPVSEGSDYTAALDAFRARHVRSDGKAGLVEAYRAVQAIPYRSVADRRPLTALVNNEGACTAKHLILRDLLRRMGHDAVIELVEGDFAAGMPVAGSMPDALKAMIREAGVIDLHCRVRLQGPDGPQRLDATFPRPMSRLGFTVDEDWAGDGDTRQAIATVTVRAEDEDVLAVKAEKLAGFSEAMTQRRLTFLALFTRWLAEAEKDGPEPAPGA